MSKTDWLQLLSAIATAVIAWFTQRNHATLQKQNEVLATQNQVMDYHTGQIARVADKVETIAQEVKP